MIALSCLLLVTSLKMMAPSFGLSMSPSPSHISSPNTANTRLQPGESFSTTVHHSKIKYQSPKPKSNHINNVNSLLLASKHAGWDKMG